MAAAKRERMPSCVLKQTKFQGPNLFFRSSLKIFPHIFSSTADTISDASDFDSCVPITNRKLSGSR